MSTETETVITLLSALVVAVLAIYIIRNRYG